MAKILQLIKDWFTARDGVSYSLVKLITLIAFGELSWNFLSTSSADFTGFGIAVTGLTASLAAKYYVETPETKEVK
jgi:hypothetical protein